MLRYFVRLMLFAVVLIGGSMFAAQWKLKDNLKDFANTVRPFMEFDYDAASVSYTGEVKINGISLFIQSMGVHIDIGELKFFTGNLYQLATLKSNIKAQKLPEQAHLILKNVLLPFDSKMLRVMDKNVTVNSADILDTAFCGEITRFGLDEFEAMGYSYLSFSSEMFYLLDKRSGSITLSGNVDIEDAYKTDYQINISGVLSWIEEVSEQMSGAADEDSRFITPDLSLLEVRVQDQGLHLKKAEYCSQQENSNTDYYSGHAAEIEQLLSGVDIILPEDFKSLYIESIQPDSRVNWLFRPKINFKLENIKNYDYSQLVEASGLEVEVNNKPVDLTIEGLSFKKMSKLVALVRVQKEKEETLKPRYKLITIRQSFQKVSIGSMANYIKYRVRVTRNDGQLFEGKLAKMTRDKVWIIVRSKEGSVTLPVSLRSIKGFDVYKEIPRD